MAIPTGATRLRLKIAPQRGQVLALAEIIAPHARHEVILVMMLPRCLATAHLQVPVCDLSATRPSSRQASLRRGGRESYSRAGLLSSTNDRLVGSAARLVARGAGDSLGRVVVDHALGCGRHSR
jgi:hypothetical protein